MNLEDLKKEFDEALDKMSDEDIIEAFVSMGCEVKIG